MYILDPSLQDQAVAMATKIDNDTEGVTLNVSGLSASDVTLGQRSSTRSLTGCYTIAIIMFHPHDILHSFQH